MKKVNKIIRIVTAILLLAAAVCSFFAYFFAQNLLKYIGYGAVAASGLALIINELVTAYKKAKENGQDFGLLDFLKVVYNCIPILIGYAESLDKTSGGQIKGNDKANAVIDQLKLLCDQQQVKFYEEQARAIITPIIESEKIIDKVKNGTLTFGDVSAMLNGLKAPVEQEVEEDVSELLKANAELDRLIEKK